MSASDPSPTVAPDLETGPALSAVGFGCAGLMRLPSARERRNLIHAAIDAGLTHFDVARMYGLGAAEGELGAAIRGRRDRLTVATKFGIDASGALQRLGRLQAPARALLARSSKVRSAVRGRRELFATPRRYDADTARISLDRSLQALGLDHVEILFLHDPRPQDEIDGAALVEFLDAARASGKIGAWGVSLDDPAGLAVLARLNAPCTLQLRHDALASEHPGEPSITFGVMSAHGAIRHWLEQAPQRRAQWSSALGADPLAGELLASLLVSEARARGSVRTVLYSTTNPSRLAAMAPLARAPLPSHQLEAFAALLAASRAAIRAGS